MLNLTVVRFVMSAPGKVLLTGAYLILDRSYRGIVCTLSPRVTARVRLYPLTDEERKFTMIDVTSRSPAHKFQASYRIEHTSLHTLGATSR